MMNDPILISERDVSVAWRKAVDSVLVERNAPICVSIVGLENGVCESRKNRVAVDRFLKSHGIISVRETSETLFPYSFWSMKRPSCEELSKWYIDRYIPKHRSRMRVAARGVPKETYFERLVSYNGFKVGDGAVNVVAINQLQRIIETYKIFSAMGKSPSPSKYIATCLNPSVDNTNNSPYVPFPCLQQVGFSFVGGKVVVSGFYTIQYLIKRGYGNYLGLCYLGQFLAHETGLPLSRVNCFVGNPRIDGVSVGEVEGLFATFEVEA